MKLELKGTKTTEAGEKVMEQIHFGFGLKIGEEGYTTFKAATAALKAKGYRANDRAVIAVLASKESADFEDALATVSEAVEKVTEYLKEAEAEDIAKRVLN